MRAGVFSVYTSHAYQVCIAFGRVVLLRVDSRDRYVEVLDPEIMPWNDVNDSINDHDQYLLG